MFRQIDSSEPTELMIEEEYVVEAVEAAMKSEFRRSRTILPGHEVIGVGACLSSSTARFGTIFGRWNPLMSPREPVEGGSCAGNQSLSRGDEPCRKATTSECSLYLLERTVRLIPLSNRVKISFFEGFDGDEIYRWSMSLAKQYHVQAIPSLYNELDPRRRSASCLYSCHR